MANRSSCRFVPVVCVHALRGLRFSLHPFVRILAWLLGRTLRWFGYAATRPTEDGFHRSIQSDSLGDALRLATPRLHTPTPAATVPVRHIHIFLSAARGVL